MTALGDSLTTLGESPGTVPVPPPVGEWCEITRGFWEGGAYARADTLAAGDTIRVGTYTGYAVTRVVPVPAQPRWYPARVFVHYASRHDDASVVLSPEQWVERATPAACEACGCTRAIVAAYAAADGITDPVCCGVPL